MKAVLSQPASADRGHWEKGYRALYKKNPAGFMADYSRLTAGTSDGVCPHCGKRADEEKVSDEGSARARALLEKILS